MDFSFNVWVYVGVVVVAGVALLLRMLYVLRATTRERQEALEARSTEDPVATRSPVRNSAELTRARGLRSIEESFTVTRRLVVPLVIVGTAAVASLPFLSMVPASLVSLLIAGSTVLLGMAARPFIENAIAGLVISGSKLINIGDTVKIDTWYGTVEDIRVTHTTLRIWDWRRYVVPNTQMLQQKFVHYSLFDGFMWAYVEFLVSYDADLRRVREIAVETPTRSVHFWNREEPGCWVMGMERESVRCWVAAWARSPSEAWLLQHDIRTELVIRFREEGIHAHGFRFEGPSAVSPTDSGPELRAL